MARKLCSCGEAQAVRPGGLCNRCFGRRAAAEVEEPDVTIDDAFPIAKINTEAGTQARVKTDEETVAKYAADDADEADPADFPAVDLWHDGVEHYLGDGFHRVLARLRNGRTTIKAKIHKGTKLDAALHAAGANARHGLPRTDADKEKAVRMVVAMCPAWSVTQIKSAAKVSWAFADKIVRGVQGDAAPDVRAGADGKTYPARQKQPQAPARAPAADAPASGTQAPARAPGAAAGGDFPFMEGDPKKGPPPAGRPPEPETDALGEPLPPESAAAFEAFDLFVAIEKQLKQVVQQVNDLARLEGAESYRSKLRSESSTEGRERFHCSDLANAIMKLHDNRPHAARCPACVKAGAANRPTCEWCRGLPYLTERVYKRCADAVAAGGRKSA